MPNLPETRQFFIPTYPKSGSLTSSNLSCSLALVGGAFQISKHCFGNLSGGEPMHCNFEKLLALLNQEKTLSVDEQLAIHSHIEKCDICSRTIYQLARDRDVKLFGSPREFPDDVRASL